MGHTPTNERQARELARVTSPRARGGRLSTIVEKTPHNHQSTRARCSTFVELHLIPPDHARLRTYTPYQVLRR